LKVDDVIYDVNLKEVSIRTVCEKSGHFEIVDLSVESSNHNLVAGNILCHNSPKKSSGALMIRACPARS
jgi:hypothetical protein